ncbi:hypothetical protein HYPSUDRAFT_47307 [Hypholoma sublateritium FD-334 SS-4]|uniref:G-patch domain-containing protein n=1 Tax=Hypholoma sublateritium (strain FD-334 SS-4) TaxID=945553 RepID=A0A0D2KPD0_HYPSF|nr:hypothetical protein HYPSUDRAFT_47307 [Hypholoma sublateritium FD-334 SS-4]
MATVTHYIRSNYNPEDKEKLEKETGQLTEEESERAWASEAALIARRQAPAPRFVAATIPYDGWSVGQASSSKIPESSSSSLGDTLSGWYRSLSANGSKTSGTPRTETTTHSGAITRQSSTPAPRTTSAPKSKKAESRNKNNWFIMNAIQSEPLPPSSATTPNTLADMLARHPPPLPSEKKFAPPIFLEIGPSNKGFGMLQRAGWTEGEPLGPDVVRRKHTAELLGDGDMIPTEPIKFKGKLKSQQYNVEVALHQERVEVKVENFDDVSELRSVDVIDLTLSDSDSDSGESMPEGPGAGTGATANQTSRHGHEAAAALEVSDSAPGGHMTPLDPSPYARKALLTPIATVLKSDRLGIGLKAKTVGPHKASQKRITHNASALAAHVKAAEESRKRKQVFGRGHKGFERQRRKDEEKRKALLAELKSPW